VEAVVDADAVIATNTSSLPITRLAGLLAHRGRRELGRKAGQGFYRWDDT
jgi:3-hydroxyacyl-CoA dehydrogenase